MWCRIFKVRQKLTGNISSIYDYHKDNLENDEANIILKMKSDQHVYSHEVRHLRKAVGDTDISLTVLLLIDNFNVHFFLSF